MQKIYLDNAATTPVCDAAFEKFNEISRENWGNASALHEYGRRASQILEQSKHIFTELLGDGEAVFTSGGTESNNLALYGVCDKHRSGRIIITADEHSSLLNPVKQLGSKGFDVVMVPFGGGEETFLNNFSAALTPDTIFCGVMAVNNETGLIFPVKKVAVLTHKIAPNAVFHTDAVQAFCKIPFSPKALGVDTCSFSGHKIGAFQGAGALWIKKGVKLTPRFYGGRQQNSLRPGTEPIALIGAFAETAKQMAKTLPERTEKAKAFFETLRNRLFGSEVLFNGTFGSPFIGSISLPKVPSEVLMRFLEENGILVSAGSACMGGKTSPAAADLIGENAKYTLRVSLGPQNTPDDAAALAAVLILAQERFAKQVQK
ncbi:MAG TPA: cysteine desulfurase family protein [Oscillospiraceae bacterium]|nr:cysteine desulfurase family protein [Oscillospiraceae bacterium]HPF56134.1 cysteine desulfurase family protein [Clostridiales bacterium]HPK35408.1 cysteine desulfurase family protein [Oscillospiraceae bacterium]HPR75299.1 cysteine desulfurase family protein [Oscillospiraceae bacterium]